MYQLDTQELNADIIEIQVCPAAAYIEKYAMAKTCIGGGHDKCYTAYNPDCPTGMWQHF